MQDHINILALDFPQISTYIDNQINNNWYNEPFAVVE